MSSSAAANKIWLITGASSGLGLEMGLAALHAGHRVIGTGRDIRKAASANPEFEKLGGRWLQLDVAQAEAQTIVENLVKEEEDKLEKSNTPHWVVVNNAGSTLLGAVEDMSENQIVSYLQANVLGCIRVWKAMLPRLRKHRQGTLITVSSIWGFIGKPEHMIYSAVKATQESLTESYVELLAPFGIRTMIIEPGGFRTNFPGNNAKSDLGIADDYKDTITKWMQIVDAAGKDPTMVNGDPRRFGRSVLDAVEGRDLFKQIWETQTPGNVLRIQFGSDCYDLFAGKLQLLNEGYQRMAKISKSTDVES